MMDPQSGGTDRAPSSGRDESSSFDPSTSAHQRPGWRSDVTDAVIHELNQPLSAILLTARAAVRMIDSPSDPVDIRGIRDLLTEIIVIDTHAAAVMPAVRGLVTDDPAPMQEIHASDLVRDVLAVTRTTLAAGEVAVDSLTESNLPPVYGNRVQLQEVFVNLIVNACEAMGSVPLGHRRLRIAAEKRLFDVVFSVSDTGPGLPAQSRDRIFSAHESTKAGGTGLGLALCHKMIIRHGGKIWAESCPSGGSTICFQIPAAEAGRSTRATGAAAAIDSHVAVMHVAADAVASNRRLRGELLATRARTRRRLQESREGRQRLPRDPRASPPPPASQ